MRYKSVCKCLSLFVHKLDICEGFVSNNCYYIKFMEHKVLYYNFSLMREKKYRTVVDVSFYYQKFLT